MMMMMLFIRFLILFIQRLFILRTLLPIIIITILINFVSASFQNHPSHYCYHQNNKKNNNLINNNNLAVVGIQHRHQKKHHHPCQPRRHHHPASSSLHTAAKVGWIFQKKKSTTTLRTSTSTSIIRMMMLSKNSTNEKNDADGSNGESSNDDDNNNNNTNRMMMMRSEAYRCFLQNVQELQLQQEQQQRSDYDEKDVTKLLRLVTNNEVEATTSSSMLKQSELKKGTTTKTTTTTIPTDNNSNNNVVPINSLIFEIISISNNNQNNNDSNQVTTTSTSNYVLVLIPSQHYVNVTALSECLNNYNYSTNNNDDDNTAPSAVTVRLAPADRIEQDCGFPPGCVPPIGLRTKPPFLVVIDEALAGLTTTTITTAPTSSSGTKNDDANIDHTMIVLVGGGGMPNQSCILTNQALFNYYPSAIVHKIREEECINNNNNINDNNELPIQRDQHDGLYQTKTATSTSTISSKDVDEAYASESMVRLQEIVDTLRREKPYFVVAPPPEDVAKIILRRSISQASDATTTATSSSSVNNPLKSEYVSIIGRIGPNIRQMASKLVFYDLLPPPDITTTSNGDENSISNSDEYPWRCPVSGKEMAVQIIGGKTICHILGEEQGLDALKRLSRTRQGDLVWIQGKTNVNTIDSLQNWVSKRTLDIVLLSYQIIQTKPTETTNTNNNDNINNILANANGINGLNTNNDDGRFTLESPNMNTNTVVVNGAPYITNGWQRASQPSKLTMKTQKGLRKQQRQEKQGELLDPSMYLTINEIYTASNTDDNNKTDKRICIMVDSLKSLKEFAHVVQQLRIPSKDSNIESSTNLLFGFDCEWKPNFLMTADDDPRQPVMVLQICIHALQEVYILDLHALLRPFLSPTHSMNEQEEILSNTIGCILQSEVFIKVGYQVVQDLRKIATSYPHISGFQTNVLLVLEISSLFRKVFRLSKQPKTAVNKDALSSLSKLTYKVIGKYLNKSQQCSDWSSRPLSTEQINYAALDAIVTCVLVEKLLQSVEAHFTLDVANNVSIQIRRWDGDLAFQNMLLNWRFTVVPSASSSATPNIEEPNPEGTPTTFLSTVSASQQNELQTTNLEGKKFYVLTQSWMPGAEVPHVSKHEEFAEDCRQADSSSPRNSVGMSSKMIIIKSPNFHSMMDAIVGEQVGNTKNKCIDKLVSFGKTDTALLEGSVVAVDFARRSGYVEFKDGLALFVNMPDSVTKTRFNYYPNEWLNDGQILTWFLHPHEWKDGTSELAMKLISPYSKNDDKNSIENSTETPVILFVRLTNGSYVCCGRCKAVFVPPPSYDKKSNEPWKLIQLHLMLQDWNKLMQKPQFQKMINPSIMDSHGDSDS